MLDAVNVNDCPCASSSMSTATAKFPGGAGPLYVSSSCCGKNKGRIPLYGSVSMCTVGRSSVAMKMSWGGDVGVGASVMRAIAWDVVGE